MKHVILLTLDINMLKLDSTRPKHVIKANKNKQKSKNPKFSILGTSMRVHTKGMRAHPNYMPRNTISELQTK